MRILTTLLVCLVFQSSCTLPETTTGVEATPEEQRVLNSRLAYLLGDQELRFHVAHPGMEIPLHSVVVVSPFSPGNCEKQEQSLSLRFETAKVGSNVDAEEKDRDVAIISRSVAGLELVLHPKEVKMEVSQGVLFHVRDDLHSLLRLPSEQRLFKSLKGMGRVTAVKGRVLVSTDATLIKEKLVGLWIDYPGLRQPCVLGENCIQAPDGTYVYLGRPPSLTSPCTCEGCEPQPEMPESEPESTP